MILEIDLGNSQIKWRLLATDRAGVAASTEACLAAFASLPRPQLIRLASVRSDDSVRRIADWTQSQWSIRPLAAVVSAECGAVVNSYREPAQLGVDRWLAMLAAYELTHSACVIVDSGTALTVDVLDGGGHHQGGYIVPGFALATDSLEANTGIRLTTRDPEPLAGLGTSTEQAVLGGILNQATALIEKVVHELAASESAVAVLLSGGDNNGLFKALDKLMPDRLQVCPSLVLDGLALVQLQEVT